MSAHLCHVNISYKNVYSQKKTAEQKTIILLKYKLFIWENVYVQKVHGGSLGLNGSS